MLTTWKPLVTVVLPHLRHYAHGSEADAAMYSGVYGDRANKEADVRRARIWRQAV